MMKKTMRKIHLQRGTALTEKTRVGTDRAVQTVLSEGQLYVHFGVTPCPGPSS